jgi:hypothetical protein
VEGWALGSVIGAVVLALAAAVCASPVRVSPGAAAAAAAGPVGA